MKSIRPLANTINWTLIIGTSPRCSRNIFVIDDRIWWYNHLRHTTTENMTTLEKVVQNQNRFIVRCTKYTIQKHINIQGKTFWNSILRIWYTDMTYDRHCMWGKLLRFRKRYLRFNGLRRDLHTRNQHCHDTKCRPFNARRTKTY